MINVGIIGAGRIGQVHAKSILTGVPQAHILAIVHFAIPYSCRVCANGMLAVFHNLKAAAGN